MRLRLDFSANHRLDSLRVFTLIVDLVFTRLNACKIMWLRSKWWECRLIYIKSSFAQSKTSSTIIFYLLSIHLIFPHHPEQRRGIKANRRTTVKPLPLAHIILPSRFQNMIIFMSTVILTQFRFDIKINVIIMRLRLDFSAPLADARFGRNDGSVDLSILNQVLRRAKLPQLLSFISYLFT